MSTIKHLLAFPSCSAAPAVDLAPKEEGRVIGPGTTPDNDGIACEPWPRVNQPFVYHVR